MSTAVSRVDGHLKVMGAAKYPAEFSLPNLAYAFVVTSPVSKGTITAVDSAAAEKSPGVLAVFTGKDIEGNLNAVPCAWLVPNSDLKVAAYPCIAKDVVHYAGDIVAGV